MSPRVRIEDLLAKHKLLSDKIESTPALSSFIEDVLGVIETAKEEQLQAKRISELALKELQAWSKAVEQREAIIKSVLDVSTDNVITLNAEGLIAEFNHVAEKTFGVQKNDVVGISILNLICRGQLFEQLALFFSGNFRASSLSLDGMRMRFQVITKGNYEFPADVAINRIETGSEIIYPLFIRDLSEQIAAQKILEESRGQATHSAKMASLGEMAGGIAHEINTPLNVFTMYAEMLRDSALNNNLDPKTTIEAANTIEETALRISKIIQGLRNFSRDDSGDEMILVPITQIVSETLALCRQRFTSNGIRLAADDFSPDWVILCRPTSLCQVLLNLLNNAYDAIEHLPDRWIQISCQEDPLNYDLSVTDCGPGIPAPIAKRLMEPFFTTKGIGKGTGLGLSLSKGIVEKHSGELTYDSNSPNTRFVISLPKVIINKLAV